MITLATYIIHEAGLVVREYCAKPKRRVSKRRLNTACAAMCMGKAWLDPEAWEREQKQEQEFRQRLKVVQLGTSTGKTQLYPFSVIIGITNNLV